MAITRKWLESNASPMSFERGRELAESQNIEVTQVGLVYDAKVYGEQPYLVQFQDMGAEPTATCTCPFDWGGVCKHIVAVGLTIVKGEYESLDVEELDSGENEDGTGHIDAKLFMDYTFLKAAPELQSAFLHQLFSQNPVFMAQFHTYIESEASVVDRAELDFMASRVMKDFSKIPLDIEKRRNRYDDNYYYEADDGSEWATQKLNEKFGTYFLQGQELLSTGNLMAFLSFEVGVYEGLMAAESPIYNPNYEPIFKDYRKILRNIFMEHLQKSFPFLSKMVIKDTMANACSDLLLDRAATHVYDLSDWEAFWMHLILTEGSASHLLERLKGASVGAIPRLVMKGAQLLGDVDTWAKTAEDYCVKNRDISLEILRYYHQKQNVHGLVGVVSKIFTQEQYSDTSLLLNYITPQADRALYMNVLSVEVCNKRKISLYRDYAALASKEEKSQLLEKINRNSYYALFNAEVLAEEGLFEKVFPLMERCYAEKDVPPMLKLVVTPMTEKAWEWTQTFVTEKLENSKTSRELYHALVQCLALFLPIEPFAPLAKTYAASLQDKYKKRTALRDELQFFNLI